MTCEGAEELAGRGGEAEGKEMGSEDEGDME